MNIPAESLEMNYPIRVNAYRLWPDSAGAGLHRGGLGVVREIEILRGDVTMTLREDRHRTQPWGLYGGKPALLARAEISRGAGPHESIASKGVFALAAGDRVTCWASGGAGYGDPLQRDAAQVREDIIDRKITPAAAREDYGVVFTQARDVDIDATQRLRAELRAARGATDWTYDRGQQRRA
jgi:N-methylhydantoinase B